MAVKLPLPNKDELKPIKGLKLGIAEAGIKRANRKDVLVIRLVPGSSVSGVFTQNRFCAAPVQLCRAHLLERNPIEALIINTGNANAGTGNEGLRRAQQTCDALAHALGIAVIIFSTGKGSRMTPVEKGKICSGLMSKALANASQVCCARRKPSSPVPALALPVLIIKASIGLRSNK